MVWMLGFRREFRKSASRVGAIVGWDFAKEYGEVAFGLQSTLASRELVGNEETYQCLAHVPSDNQHFYSVPVFNIC